MEAIGTVASIATILSSLKWCYVAIKDMRYAWQHGPRDLLDFCLKIKLFKRALKKVRSLTKSDPEHANDLRRMGFHILADLERLLRGFRKSLPDLDRSKTARARIRIQWYFQRKTVENLLRAISRGEVSLTLWIAIDTVHSRDRSIMALQAQLENLRSLGMSVSVLEHEVYVIKNIQTKSGTKQHQQPTPER